MASAKESKETKSDGKAASGGSGKKSNPRQAIWQAGEQFYNALLEANDKTVQGVADAAREHQERVLELQGKARQRAGEIHAEYLSSLNEAQQSANSRSAGIDAARAYREALADFQATMQKESLDLAESGERTRGELETQAEQSRYAAYVDYCRACQKVWQGIDADSLACEDLAFIGHSMMLGAQLVGGRS